VVIQVLVQTLKRKKGLVVMMCIKEKVGSGRNPDVL